MNKYVAQLALVLLFLAFACPVVIRAADAPAQPPAISDAELFKTIAALDAEVFDAYNRCDLDKFASYFIENLEFYHDKGGVMWTRKDVVDATRKNICGKVRRELVKSSLAVYPIKDFGAFETGEHLFCHVGAEKCEGIGKFAMIWQQTNGHWQITRVISFDHRAAPNRPPRRHSGIAVLPFFFIVPCRIPSNVTAAAYLPSNYRKSRAFLENLGFWIQPGKSLEDGVSAVLQHYFTASFLSDPQSDWPYGLLIAIHPQWKFESGTIRMTMKYQVYGAQSTVLLEGKQTFVTPLGNANSSNGFYNAAPRTSQLVVADVLTKLHPDESKFPTGTRLKDVSPEVIVDREQPIATGTGFFINASGQVITAAHVLHDCVTTEVKRDDQIYHSRPVASSILLDLAVIDTGVPVTRFLPLRKDSELNLGEPVANVGFPLQSILAASSSASR